MAKYKINLPKDYKEVFTLADIEHINEVKKGCDIQSDAECMLSVLCSGSEVLKSSFTWAKSIDGFYDNKIDILLEVVIWDTYKEVRYISATFSEINTICDYDDRMSCGYQKVFERKW